MSKINHTENLNLTQYVNIRLPIFFNDYTDDMRKIDQAWGSIASRLSAVEEVIDKVSTQNIDDLIARIDALEEKVEVNSTQIHTINDKIDAIENRIADDETAIRNNTSQISALNGRVSVLEECCSEVRDTLTAHANKIAKNEDDISDILIRLERDESNIQGNARDIIILGEQVATNTKNIDDLMHALDDIDPSSTLELVRQVAANTDNITSLFSITSSQTSRIDGVITRIASDEAEITNLGRRMTSAEEALAQVGDWQDKIDTLDAEVQEMSGEFDTLTTLVNGYDSRITAVEQDDATFTSYMNSNNTRVGVVETKVSALETEDTVIYGRLDAVEDDITHIKQTIHDDEDGLAALTSKVGNIETDIGSEDISGYGASVKSAILEAFSRIAVNKSAIGALSNLATSAKNSLVDAVNEVVQGVNNVNTNVGDLSALTTTVKSSLVGAVNEVVQNINDVVSNVGSLVQLKTTAKSNLVDAINELFDRPSVPAGVISPFGGNSAPSGWLLCDGSAVSREEYAQLFDVIGDSYGAGDGSTTFNLPNFTGRTAMGAESGHAVGATENGALPNISGSLYPSTSEGSFDMDMAGSGAIVATNSTRICAIGSHSYSAWTGFTFDASRSSSLYVNQQNKVDPANVRVNYIIKV